MLASAVNAGFRTSPKLKASSVDPQLLMALFAISLLEYDGSSPSSSTESGVGVLSNQPARTELMVGDMKMTRRKILVRIMKQLARRTVR